MFRRWLLKLPEDHTGGAAVLGAGTGAGTGAAGVLLLLFRMFRIRDCNSACLGSFTEKRIFQSE